MQITYPDYYKEFSCSADKCKDTCCAGWGIVIDDNTLKKYDKTAGRFAGRLRQQIDWKRKSFCQNKGKCAFLNEKNLCDIYTELGKTFLCDTCKRYPRHIEEFENLREVSLSLSCPKVADIVLSRQEKVCFITGEKNIPQEEYEKFDFFLFDKLMNAREFLLEILQNRNYSIEYRMGVVLGFAHDLQRRIENQEIFQIDQLIEKYRAVNAEKKLRTKMIAYGRYEKQKKLILNDMMEALKSFEVLKPEFPQNMEEYQRTLFQRGNIWYQTKKRLFQKSELYPPNMLEQLLVYFVFTYFCGAVYDKEAYAKIKMAVVSTLLIREWMLAVWIKEGEQMNFSHIVDVCYRYSRELEHSDINLSKMEEMMKRKEIFSLQNLLTVIMN